MHSTGFAVPFPPAQAPAATVLAKCWQGWLGVFVGVQITIRDVDEDVRDELAARAAGARKSMQEYLKGELERLARRPSADAWVQAVQKRKKAAPRRIPARDILRARDADRR